VLYDYAWFVGFGVAVLVHWALMKLAPPAAAGEIEGV
jgi:cytosine/uracil/thiamine/allantoin permease